jgi:hypothetical protein
VTRPLGHRPDYPIVRAYDGEIIQSHRASDWLFHESQVALMRPRSGASSWDYSDRLDAVQNQIGGTCVGHAIASSVYLRAQIEGKPIRRPSATMTVAIAQLVDAPGKPIDCDGCRPSVAVAALRDRGLVADEDWPETTENLNSIPPEDVFARAEGATVDAWYRIPSGGDVVGGLKQALARGYLPIFAMQVDAKFEQIGSGIYDGPGGKILGNHAQVVVGYSAIVDAFMVLNSWGDGFGDGGLAWITPSAMARMSFDRIVIQTSPAEV